MKRRPQNNRWFTNTNLIVGFASVLLVIMLTSYFLDKNNLKYSLMEYGVILNDSTYYSDSYLPDWHKIEVGAFYIHTPRGYKLFRLCGLDSYVAGLTNQQDTFHLDYGLYSNSLDVYSPPDYKIIDESINNKAFRVVLGQNEIKYIGAYTDNLTNGNKLMIECRGCTDLDEKHKIIQTIEFKKK
jgi:hypothetical protein